MTDLGDFLSVMQAFRDRELSAGDFVSRYSELWEALVKEQDDAIARHAVAGGALQELRELLRYSEITAEAYTRKAEEQYGLLEGLSIRPGSLASKTLSHVAVEADAYRDDETGHNDSHPNADELREVVRQALGDLSTS
jgi:hypothetical protein